MPCLPPHLAPTRLHVRFTGSGSWLTLCGGGGVGGGGVPVSLSVDRGVRGGQTRRPVGSGVSHLLTCYKTQEQHDVYVYVGLCIRVGQ